MLKKTFIPFIGQAITIIFIATSSLSIADEGWTIDKRTGCAVFNVYPEPSDSVTWSGSCLDGMANGYGTLQWNKYGSPKDRYIGEYQSGKMNGRGLYIWENGDKYDGEFQDDEQHGHGVIILTNNNKYAVEYQNGEIISINAVAPENNDSTHRQQNTGESLSSLCSEHPIMCAVSAAALIVGTGAILSSSNGTPVEKVDSASMNQLQITTGMRVQANRWLQYWVGEVIEVHSDSSENHPWAKILVTHTTDKSSYNCNQIIDLYLTDIKKVYATSIKLQKCP